MAARGLVKELCEEASCSICLDFFRDPVITECGHSFCRGCLTRSWGESGAAEPSCPQCRARARRKNLRLNQPLANFVELARKFAFQEGKVAGGKGGVCEKHREPLELFCPVEKSPLCVVCGRSQEHRGHQVVPLKTTTQERKQPFVAARKERVCPKHQKPIKLFCEDDKALICVVCDRSKEHRDHKTLPLEEASQEYKDSFMAQNPLHNSGDEDGIPVSSSAPAPELQQSAGSEHHAAPPLLCTSRRSRDHDMEAPGSLLQPFNINRPELWDSWAEGFEFYLEFWEITTEAKKKALFLSACGTETLDLARDLIQPKKLMEATSDEIIQALASYFVPQLSKLACRWEFRQRAQNAGEPATEYLAALRRLARRCKFEELNEMLLEQFIWGLKSEKLSSKIVDLPECDLAKAVEFATGWEKGHHDADHRPLRRPAANQTSMAVATSNSDRDDVLQVCQVPRGKGRPPARPNNRWADGAASCSEDNERCSCHFRNATCRMCGKVGHIARVCHSKATGRTTGSRRSAHSEELLDE